MFLQPEAVAWTMLSYTRSQSGHALRLGQPVSPLRSWMSCRPQMCRQFADTQHVMPILSPVTVIVCFSLLPCALHGATQL